MDQLGFFATDGALALDLSTTQAPPEITVIDRILACADDLATYPAVDHRLLKDLG
ncbi:MAG TPA: hypothetical protein VNF68_11580 [Candidatus Baltobacteraceae bacterium]|nr:hypothetical protein [Candidatus Baltobacteraceae bacterium]